MDEQSFAKLIEKKFLEQASEQAKLFRSLGVFMSSDYGEDFRKLCKELINGFAERGLFAEEDKERYGMQGAVIALQTLLSQAVELAARDQEIGEREADVSDMVPGYVTLGEDDEL